jgi:maltose/moltooligosaccharide transporter
MQSFFIGVGAVVADMLPWMLKNWFHVSSETGSVNAIPPNVKISFYLGAAAFFCAVLWTVLTTKEYPPEDLEAFRRGRAERGGLAHLFTEIPDALRKMPGTMRRLALVQFFTWMGLFCMWLHFSNAVPVIFGTSDPNSPLFKEGVEWAGVCYAARDAVTFLAAFALMAAKMPRRWLHGICLTLGAIGEAQKGLLLAAMALGGVAWASILSMPYAILSGALPPERMGVYMGIFNFFIVLPQIITALTFGPLVKHVLGGNLVHAVMAGGVVMLLAALLTLGIKEAPVRAPAS